MLTELKISNFAIIEEQVVSFDQGLIVISGETGTGKSVLLQALELILGGRTNQKYLRANTDGWEIQAHFDLSNLSDEIKISLPDIAQEEELSIQRSMSATGRSKVYINGKLGTVSLLQDITSKIVNICGQGQHIKLLEHDYHLNLLDDFANNQELLKTYQNQYQNWKELRTQYDELEEKLENNVLRKAELEFLVNELEKLNLTENLRENLETKVNKLTSSEKLLEYTNKALSTFGLERGIYDQVNKIKSFLVELEKKDPETKNFLSLIETAYANLNELEVGLSSYLNNITVDEDALDTLRDKLANVAACERKYRTNSAGLLNLLGEAQSELELLDDANVLSKLKSKLLKEEKKLDGLAQKLTASREQASKSFTELVQEELAELNMTGVKLSVSFEEIDYSITGKEKIQFLIATNPGESLKALKEVASGGELSRIMLVLKKVLRDKTGVNVLVFDEIDSGISGGVARAVGAKLKFLSDSSQVVCITHLAQVASFADQHFLVDKIQGKRTRTSIRELKEDEKIDEIARMLSGFNITEASRLSAKELLSH